MRCKRLCKEPRLFHLCPKKLLYVLTQILPQLLSLFTSSLLKIEEEECNAFPL